MEYKELEAACRQHIGDIYRDTEEYDRAQKMYDESLSIFQDINHPLGQASVLGSMGDFHNERDAELAKSFFQKSIDIAVEMGNGFQEASATLGLGNSNFIVENSDEAISCYRQSRELSQKLGYYQIQFKSSLGLGNVYYFTRRYQLAIGSYEECLNTCQKTGGREGEAISLYSLGNCHLCLKDYESAAYYYQEAENIFAELQLPLMVEECQTALANCHPPPLTSRLLRHHKLLLYFGMGFTIVLFIWRLKNR